MATNLSSSPPLANQDAQMTIPISQCFYMIPTVITSFKQIASSELLLFNATKANLSHFYWKGRQNSFMTEAN